MSEAYHASVNVICFENCILYRSGVILCCVRGGLPWRLIGGGGGGVVSEVDCKFSDWLTCISQRTKRTVAFCRRGLGREGIGTSTVKQ